MVPHIEQNANQLRQVVLVGLTLLFLLLIAGIVLTASVPPVCRDGLTHHLAIPKLFIKHGGIVELPDIPFSYYPMNLDLLYLAALSLGNDIMPKYIHLLFGVLTAGLMYHYLKARMGVIFSVMGALIWMSTPIVIRLSSEVYVDLGVAFFGFASIFMITRWIDSEFKMRYVIGSGVWCGLALGTKYNALLILTILSLAVPFIRARSFSSMTFHQQIKIDLTPENDTKFRIPLVKVGDVRTVVSSAICFCVISLTVYSPWMIRNYVLKQNPFYPMFQNVFNSKTLVSEEWNQTSTMVQDMTGSMTIRNLVYKESLGYMAMMPLRIFFEGRDDSPRHFDGRLNPFLLIFTIIGFLPFGTLPPKIRREHHIWWWFAVLFILMSFFTAPIRIRYLVPALPAIVVLAMIGVYRSWRAIARINRPTKKIVLMSALCVVIILLYSYNANYFIERFQTVQPLEYLRGEVTRDDYIAERRPEYPLIRHINANLSQDSVILALFLGERRYYFDRDVFFNENILKKSLLESSRPDEVFTKIRNFGITHIIVRADLFNNWITNILNDEEKKVLKEFWGKHIELVNAHSGYYLFGIN